MKSKYFLFLILSLISFTSKAEILTKESQTVYEIENFNSFDTGEKELAIGNKYIEYNDSEYLCFKYLIDENPNNIDLYSLQSFSNLECNFQDKNGFSYNIKLDSNYVLFENTLLNRKKTILNYIIVKDSGEIDLEETEQAMKALSNIIKNSFNGNIDIDFLNIGNININSKSLFGTDYNNYMTQNYKMLKKMSDIVKADFFILITEDFSWTGLFGKTFGFGPPIEGVLAPSRGVMITDYAKSKDELAMTIHHELGHTFGLFHDLGTNSNDDGVVEEKIVYDPRQIMLNGKGLKNPLKGEYTIMAYPNVEESSSANKRIYYKDGYSNRFSNGELGFENNRISNDIKDFSSIGDEKYDLFSSSWTEMDDPKTISNENNKYFNKGANSVEALNVSLSLWADAINREIQSYYNKGSDSNDHIFMYKNKLYDGEVIGLANKGSDYYYMFSGEFDIDLNNGDKKVYIPSTNNSKISENIYTINNFNFPINKNVNNEEIDSIFINESLKNDYEKNTYLEKVYSDNKIIGLVINFPNNETSLNISFDEESYTELDVEIEFSDIDGEWSSNKNIHGSDFLDLDGGINNEKLYKINIKVINDYYGGKDIDIFVGNENVNNFYGYDGDDILGSLSGKQWLGKDPAEIGSFGDYFVGGKGDDIIYGTRYGDSYEYTFGDGNDTIEDVGSIILESNNEFKETVLDKLYLKGLNYNKDPSLSDVVISRNGYDVLLNISKLNENGFLIEETITIKNMLSKRLYNDVYYYKNAIEMIYFDNGSLNLEDIIKAALTYYGDDGDNEAKGLSNYNNTFYGYKGKDEFISVGGNNTFYGGPDNDILCQYGTGTSTYYGGSGVDRLGGSIKSGYCYVYISNKLNQTLPLDQDRGQHFYGGKDNDLLYGTKFGDYYYYNLGDGKDTIFEDNPNKTGLTESEQAFAKDKIIFGEGITPEMVKISRASNFETVYLEFDENNHVRIRSAYTEYYQIEEVIFKNGTVWTADYIMEQGLIYNGDDNDNVYIGLINHNNKLYGKGGDDTLLSVSGDNLFDGGKDKDKLCLFNKGVSVFYGGDGDDKIGGTSSYKVCNFAVNKINNDIELDQDLGQKYYGGKDNDDIYGTKFGDYYYYNLGDGTDTIYENAPRVNEFTNDKIIFTGISLSDLDFLKTDNNLEVYINNSLAIVITNFYSGENYQIEEFIVGTSKYDYEYAYNKGLENRNSLDN